SPLHASVCDGYLAGAARSRSAKGSASRRRSPDRRGRSRQSSRRRSCPAPGRRRRLRQNPRRLRRPGIRASSRRFENREQLTVAETMTFDEVGLHLLDQRALPGEVRYLVCRSADETAFAIKNLVVRGAPAIGVAAAFGVALAAKSAL